MSFGGTRTYHRMVVNIEDAGFEIRDQIVWLYGSGFPKSMDISKAIDKAAGGVPQGTSDPTSPNHGKYKSGCSEENPTGRGFGAGPGQFMKKQKKDTNTLDDGVLKNRCTICDKPFFSANSCKCPKPAAATENAKLWRGWHTALKPAVEPIVLARKPLDEATIAANVLKYGTGGINVDGCRIAGHNPSINRRETARRTGTTPGKPGEYSHTIKDRRTPEAYCAEHNSEELGRFPANIILDEEAGKMLDEQSGITKSSGGKNSPRSGATIYGKYGDAPAAHNGGLGDIGGASRFFYCAKASKKERRGSKHPTVKPLSLMRYLCRLITPPGGIVLDPFAGSGTTGEAALLEGFQPILIELEADYIKDIEARLAAPINNEKKFKSQANLDDVFENEE